MITTLSYKLLIKPITNYFVKQLCIVIHSVLQTVLSVIMSFHYFGQEKSRGFV
jgi:hypothetical protein